jgi:hypothetical protein
MNRINRGLFTVLALALVALVGAKGAGNDSWFVVCASPETYHGKDVTMTGWLKIILYPDGEEYILFMSSEDMRYLLLDRSIYLDSKSMTSLLKTRFKTRDQFLNLDGHLVNISGVFASPGQGVMSLSTINDIRSVGVHGGGYTTIDRKTEHQDGKKDENGVGGEKSTSGSGTRDAKSAKPDRIGPSHVESWFTWQPFAPK